jgi:predicted AlkP superfamily pyrophosphatase or phosphodiesterase
MCHFHRVDQFQHYYGDESIGRFDQDKLLDLYRETDELASNIKQKALSAGYDCIIFMSDHGLPTEDQHNKQAFYSSNIELFGDDTPHITDFHDKILELTDD